ncbi:MAG: hypothetical protein GF355_16890 [Candidatus Eisenbacteria bacterium]|nr:hypothetical protein [Candidatus Eisenbacteria bacterium]
MNRLTTIRVDRDGPVARLVLNRPDVRNAFNEVMIAELLEALRRLAEEPDVRVVILMGEGPVFCAGADLNWMRRSAQFSREENHADAMRLATLVETLDTLPFPTVARVQGAAVGGALGLVAACDVAVAAETAFFAFSEVRLGLAPAVIAPYVLRRIGPGAARQAFVTAARIPAPRALEIGLVNRIVPEDRLEETVGETIQQLLQCGPHAQAACKELIRRVPGMDAAAVKTYTAETIADLRAGEEGREGVQAFLEKRRPAWRIETP